AARLFQGATEVLQVAEIRLPLLGGAVDAEELLEDEGMQDGHVEPAQRRGTRRRGLLSRPERNREAPSPGREQVAARRIPGWRAQAFGPGCGQLLHFEARPQPVEEPGQLEPFEAVHHAM